MNQKTFYNSSAWQWFRKYILLYYSNNGNCQCCTCGKWYTLPDKLIQVGHYYKSDSNRSVALNFFNVAPQCLRDNKYFSGKPDVMYQWLLQKHGQDKMDELLVAKNKPQKLDPYEMELIKNDYKQKFKELVKVKGNPFK